MHALLVDFHWHSETSWHATLVSAEHETSTAETAVVVVARGPSATPAIASTRAQPAATRRRDRPSGLRAASSGIRSAMAR